MGAEEEQAVVEVLRSGWIARGKRTAEFESEFCDYVDASAAVALNSCTAALHLALIAAGIGYGDEVITTPYTFAATANVIVHTGATPVFADIDPASLNIDPDAISARVNEKTRAIIPVHFGGAPCDMDRIGEIADENGLTVIEDAAHALGAECGDKIVGSISDFTAFSFYATKNITTGEGGMLTMSDESVAERVRCLSLHGMSADAWKRYSNEGHSYYEVIEPGFKYNMFDIQAALGLEQLKRDRMMHDRREHISRIYDKELASLPMLRRLEGNPADVHACHLYVVRLDLSALKLTRDEVAAIMEQLNVGVSVHFRSIHLHPYYCKRFNLQPGDFPEALRASESTLSLPVYPAMSDDDAVTTATVLKAILERYAK
jgi:dTDP-4-amino-4,6-dideoxygalactose transaminase